ncbi:MAG TPA: PadR family transcriptional regulator [Spirochaetia bacterium]|nr:PadR family transcriptional regulator [Spirochaetia bacterium]
MPKENTTRYAVLGVLGIMPCSGYDIKKIADMSISHFWSENYGHIYPVLRSLEAEGMVTKESQQTPGRPPKNVYRITERGFQELQEWLSKPAQYHPFRNELLLKLFLAWNLPASNVREKLEKERERNLRNLETFRGIEAMLKGSEPYKSQKGLPLWLATLDYGKRFSQAVIEWCDETMRTLGAPAGARDA